MGIKKRITLTVCAKCGMEIGRINIPRSAGWETVYGCHTHGRTDGVRVTYERVKGK